MNFSKEPVDFFAGLDSDPLAEAIESGTGVVREAANGYQSPTFAEPCNKCRGSGSFYSRSGRRVGQCFTCNGTGKLTFKTSRATRAANRQSAQRSAAKKADDAFAAFTQKDPMVAEWIATHADSNDFARTLKEKIGKFGDLTEGQTTAVLRIIERTETRKVEKAAREAAAPVLDVAPIAEVFDRYRAQGAKRPAIRAAGFKFSLAPAHGQNSGAIYVKSKGGEYLGKIADGKFKKSYACTPEQQDAVLAICADPKKAAIDYGKEFGSCAICGRELTDPNSIAAGIGPDCATKSGW